MIFIDDRWIGIYVPPTPNFPKHFHDMGVRIEASLSTSVICTSRRFTSLLLRMKFWSGKTIPPFSQYPLPRRSVAFVHYGRIVIHIHHRLSISRELVKDFSGWNLIEET